MSNTYRAGIVTAYGAARRKGYTGTYDEFCEQMAQLALIQEAVATAENAAASASASEGRAAEWATGSTGGTPSETNNAEYYCLQARAAYGAPLTAHTAEDMTDTSRVYVYTGETSGNWTNGYWYYFDGTEWAEGGIYNSEAVETDKTLNVEDKAADALAVRQALLYTAVRVSSFEIQVPVGGKAEKGSTVSTVRLRYVLNKANSDLKTLTLSDGTSQSSVKDDPSPIDLTGLSLIDNITYTLTAKDAGSPIHSEATASRDATLQFLNRCYWGAATQPEAINDAFLFLLGLSGSELAESQNRTITVDATANKFIWYAVPARFTPVIFTVGGFAGGFDKIQTFDHTNASGYTESYDVYRSDNAGTGTTTVVITGE